MRLWAVIVVAGPLLLASCSKNSDAVTMNGAHRFTPDEITVKVGEPVTFTNEGGEAHTVTAYGDRIPEGAEYFSSGGLASESQARDNIAEALITEGDSYEVTLETPGTYEYFCIPHEQQGMKGTIVVEQ